KGRRPRAATRHARREATGRRLPAVVVDDVLDHDQLRLDVVVDDRAGPGLPRRDRPGTVAGGARLRVAGDARRAHAIAARVEGDRRAGRLGAREGRRARTAARYTHGETGCRRRPAVVV